VVTDVDWQFDDHAGAIVTSRLFIATPGHEDREAQRLMESSIVLSDAGRGGTVTSWTGGAVFDPGTKIGIDTSPIAA
jgi:hypothetical protein